MSKHMDSEYSFDAPKPRAGRPVKDVQVAKSVPLVALEYTTTREECLASVQYMTAPSMNNATKSFRWLVRTNACSVSYVQLAAQCMTAILHTRAVYALRLLDGWAFIAFARDGISYRACMHAEFATSITAGLFEASFAGIQLITDNSFADAVHKTIHAKSGLQQAQAVYQALMKTPMPTSMDMPGFVAVYDGSLLCSKSQIDLKAFSKGTVNGLYTLVKSLSRDYITQHIEIFAGPSLRVQTATAVAPEQQFEAYLHCYESSLHTSQLIDQAIHISLQHIRFVLCQSDSVLDQWPDQCATMLKNELRRADSIITNLEKVRLDFLRTQTEASQVVGRISPMREMFGQGILQTILAVDSSVDVSSYATQDLATLFSYSRHLYRILSKDYSRVLTEQDNTYQQIVLFGPSGTGKSSAFNGLLQKLRVSAKKVTLEANSNFLPPDIVQSSVLFTEEFEFGGFHSSSGKALLKNLFDINSDLVVQAKNQHDAVGPKGQHLVVATNFDFMSHEVRTLGQKYLRVKTPISFMETLDPWLRRCSVYNWSARRVGTFTTFEQSMYSDERLFATILVYGFLLSPKRTTSYPCERFVFRPHSSSTALYFPNPWPHIEHELFQAARRFAKTDPIVRLLLGRYIQSLDSSDWSSFDKFDDIAYQIQHEYHDAIREHFESFVTHDYSVPWLHYSKRTQESLARVLKLQSDLVDVCTEDAQCNGRGKILDEIQHACTTHLAPCDVRVAPTIQEVTQRKAHKAVEYMQAFYEQEDEASLGDFITVVVSLVGPTDNLEWMMTLAAKVFRMKFWKWTLKQDDATLSRYDQVVQVRTGFTPVHSQSPSHQDAVDANIDVSRAVASIAEGSCMLRLQDLLCGTDASFSSVDVITQPVRNAKGAGKGRSEGGSFSDIPALRKRNSPDSSCHDLQSICDELATPPTKRQKH